MSYRVHLPAPRKPTNEKRAAWYAENRTSVAKEVDRLTLAGWAYSWAGAIGWLASEGIAWVWRKVRR